VALSHVDKVVDRGYHRELGATGATLEYDGSFRWGTEPNGTLQLLEWMAEDDLLGSIVLGMDAARRGYYAAYGGAPGLTWLLDGFSNAMEERGLGAADRRRLFVENPARVFAFTPVDGGRA
jgi:phosphotriesterase-related protein